MFNSVARVIEIIADGKLITRAVSDDEITAFAFKRGQLARLHIGEFNRIGVVGSCLVIVNRINTITERKLIGVTTSTTIQCVVVDAADEQVIASIAVQRICPRSSEQQVVASVTG